MNDTLKGVAHIGAELAAAKADLQREMERHRKTWRQLEQVTGLLALSQQAEPVRAKPDLVEGRHYTSTRGFGAMTYIGETNDIDGWLPTFRLQDGRNKVYSHDELPSALVEFAQPVEPAPAQDDDDYMPEGLVGAIMHSEVMDAPSMAVAALQGILTQQRELIDRQSKMVGGLLSAPAQDEQQPYMWVRVENDYIEDYTQDANLAEIWLTEDWPVTMPLYAAPIAQTTPQVPERLPVEPYQTVDRSSTNYKAGWNACRKAMLEGQTAPQPEQSGLYTCIGKGGSYELIGRATTAGALKVAGRFADEVIVYRDTESSALYCREPGDFRLRMARAALSTQGGDA